LVGEDQIGIDDIDAIAIIVAIEILGAEENVDPLLLSASLHGSIGREGQESEHQQTCGQKSGYPISAVDSITFFVCTEHDMHSPFLACQTTATPKPAGLTVK
jgi:hypothetical protein